MITGLNPKVPILIAKEDTFTTALHLNAVEPDIIAEDTEKISKALEFFDMHVDQEELKQRISITISNYLSPKNFEYGLISKAPKQVMHIVLPEGTEERILRAAEVILRRKAARLTVLGNQDEINAKIASLNLNLAGLNIIEPAKSERYEEYARKYQELRSHKGVTLETAMDIMKDESFFGTMMVHLGHADGMVSGSVNTTGHTVRPALEFVKTKPGVSSVSSVFFMCLKDHVIVYGDCAVMPNPTADELAEIAITSADTASKFGVAPRVAMLSYSTGSSGKGDEVEKVRKATELAREQAPELAVEGPIQYDAAVVPSVAKTKMPDSDVAGKATVFIFPDLNTGNNTYKAVQRTANAVAVGPVLQGLNKPINDLSRGCTIPDIINTVAITAIQAQPVDDE